MKKDTRRLSLWGICAGLLVITHIIIIMIFDWRPLTIHDLMAYAACLPLALLQAYLLTLDRRIWHVILPLVVAWVLSDFYLFHLSLEGMEFSLACLEAYAPPVYRLMKVMGGYYDTVSCSHLIFATILDMLMFVGLMVYKILIYWGVLKMAHYLQDHWKHSFFKSLQFRV